MLEKCAAGVPVVSHYFWTMVLGHSSVLLYENSSLTESIVLRVTSEGGALFSMSSHKGYFTTESSQRKKLVNLCRELQLGSNAIPTKIRALDMLDIT